MDTLDIWEKGVPLSRSFIRLGNKEKVAEYQQCQKQFSTLTMLDKINSNLNNGIESWDALSNVVDGNAPARERADALENEFREAVLRHIKNGSLVAYGYSHPRHASDLPQKVPSDLWNSFIHLDKDKLDHNGLRMDAIRLTPLQWITGPTSEEPASAGRPSRKEQIIEAFHVLVENRQIDFSKPAKHCYETVRLWVQTHYPDVEDNEKGLGDKTMANIVNHLFKAKKEEI